MNRLSSLLIVLTGAFGLMSTGGCSVASALGQPGFIDFKEDVKLGESRMRVAEVFGPPKNTTQQPPENHLLDYCRQVQEAGRGGREV
jgi:hypothetical protein